MFDVGGWGGIRTLETLARLPVFKTGAFNHSATHPIRAYARVLSHANAAIALTGKEPPGKMRGRAHF